MKDNILPQEEGPGIPLSSGIINIPKHYIVDIDRFFEDFAGTSNLTKENELYKISNRIFGHSIISEYRLKEQESTYEIKEVQYISRVWLVWPTFIVLIFSVFFLLLSGTIRLIGGFNPLLFQITQIIVPILTVISSMTTFSILWYRDMIAIEVSGLSESFTNEVTILRHMSVFGILSLTGLAGWWFGKSWISFLSGGGMLVLSVAIATGLGFQIRKSRESQSIPFYNRLMGPPVSGRYAWYSLTALLPLMSIRFFQDEFGQPIEYIILLSIVIVLTVGSVISYPGFFLLQGGIPKFEFISFTKGLRREQIWRFLYGALAIIFTGAIYYNIIYIFTSESSYLTKSILLVIATLPALYLIIGMVLQSFSLAFLVAWLFTNSRIHPNVTIEGFNGSIRILAIDGFFAGSYSIISKNYIFLSEDAEAELDIDVRDAVLAHEYAHIRNGDASLSFLLPIISSLIGVPKNIPYSLLGFRQRELSADLYAKRAMGEDAILTAIEEFRNNSSPAIQAKFGLIPHFQPFSGIPNAQGIVETVFGYFFGAFALSQAHPDFEERKMNILQSDTTPD